MAIELGDPLPGDLEIVDPSGARHRLATVCAGEPTVLIHLRHLG